MRRVSLFQVGIFILSISFSSMAKELNYPCSGAPGSYRTNPDGTEGGFVASSATIDSTIHLDLNASVCEKAAVIEGVRLLGEAEVSGRAMVRGKIIIEGRARIYGEAYLINPNGTELIVRDQARVYGNSFLQGSVVVGDTSEVFGWGKIMDYAQVLGNSKVCGNSILRDFEVISDDNSYCVQK